MRVWMAIDPRGGSPLYRQQLPAKAAEAEGVEVASDYEFAIDRDPRGRLVACTMHPHPEGAERRPILCDVAVLSRPAKTTMLELIARLQAMGTAVVVDVDDDYHAIPASHPAFHALNPSVSPYENRDILRHACHRADLVTVTTPSLAEIYGGHGRVVVLPNCVPSALLSMPRCSDGRTLGWAGVAGLHPGDLEATSGGVSQALDRVDWRFRAIGPGEHVARHLNLQSVEASGWLDPIDNYHRELGSLDVGIAPLRDSRFNRGKSNLKPVEYAARGVAPVCSPRPEYERLADEGIGLLAGDRAREWRRTLVALMTDDALREEVAQRGRAAVTERYISETQGWRWNEAWASALTRARGGTNV